MNYRTLAFAATTAAGIGLLYVGLCSQAAPLIRDICVIFAGVAFGILIQHGSRGSHDG